jgi:hypothetical protein
MLETGLAMQGKKLIERAAKILLGMANLLVPLAFILGLTLLEPYRQYGWFESTKVTLLSILIMLAMASFPTLFVYYVVHAHRNKNLTKEKKNLWTGLLFFGNHLVYPVYWYLYIWREPRTSYEGLPESEVESG